MWRMGREKNPLSFSSSPSNGSFGNETPPLKTLSDLRMDAPIDIPVTSDKPKRRGPPARFAAMMKAKESPEIASTKDTPKEAAPIAVRIQMADDSCIRTKGASSFVMSTTRFTKTVPLRAH